MQARRPCHATVCFAAVSSCSGSARRTARPPEVSGQAGSQRVGDPIDPDQGETGSGGRRTHRAHRLVARDNGGARFRRRTVEHDPHRTGARRAAMLHARHHFLSDIASLVEIDSVQAVHVGFVRERVAINEVEAAARRADGNPMRVIAGAVDQLRADQPRELLRKLLRHQDPPAERRVTRVGERQIGFHGGLAVPRRHHAETVGQVLDRDLGAQLVEAELVGETLRQRAWNSRSGSRRHGRPGLR